MRDGDTLQTGNEWAGYAEQALEPDRYRVTFSGNRLTSRETVENYLLYRAAEVTLDRGHDYFVIADRDTERSTTYHSTFTNFGYRGLGDFGGFYRYRYGYRHGLAGFGSSTAWPRDRYTSFADIVMRDGTKPSDDPDAYDARSVLDRLGPTIVRELQS